MEQSIGLLERVSGHTYDTIYDLVFTTERVIALVVEHPADVAFKFGIAEMVLGGQLGKQSERLDRRRIGEERRKVYREKGLDELVASHRFNFEIPYGAVTSVRLIRGFFRPRLKFHISGPSIAARTIRFTLAENQVQKVRDLLDAVLPSVIKEK
jgi:hypothetical protein